MELRTLVAQAIPEAEVSALPGELSIRGIACDSRKVEPGFLFVAIPGTKLDGHRFIEEALARGAAAVVASRSDGAYLGTPWLVVREPRAALARFADVFYGHPSKTLSVIGITGTNGKTTSSYLIEHLLKKQDERVGVIGTVNTRFAGKEIPAVETTPGALALQGILADMRAADCGYAVMEVSSHALDQRRTDCVDFKAALFTNLTQDHLDYHKTIENYFEAKSRLFTGLSSDALAVLNADDAWHGPLRQKVRSKCLTYGIREKCDFRARDIVYDRDFTRWRLEAGGQVFADVKSPLLGLHNVYNALGALTVLGGLGFPTERLVRHLEDFPGVSGRLERVETDQDFSVFVDFAHTPDGLLNVLNCLQRYRRKKLIVMFGCGGDRDRKKRPQMGEIASRLADWVIVTSDNPRSEDPKTIAVEICSGFPRGFSRYGVTIDRRKAIRRALLAARAGDIVLLAGKGHEKTQVIGNQTIPFSDIEEARKVLSGR